VTVSEEEIADTEKQLKELKIIKEEQDKISTKASGIDISF